MPKLQNIKKEIADISNKAKTVGRNVKDKASDVMNIAKLNGKVKDYEEEVDVCVMELGDLVLRRYKEGNLKNEEAIIICEKIEKLEKNIYDLQDKIESINEKEEAKKKQKRSNKKK